MKQKSLFFAYTIGILGVPTLNVAESSTMFIPLYALDQEHECIAQTPSYYIDLRDLTRGCSSSEPAYALLLPTAQGSTGQVLGLADAQGDLTWLTTITNSDQLQLLYTATSCDTPLTLVLRDSTGSFAATTITLTGNSLINYAADYTCGDLGQQFIGAPINDNISIGLGVLALNTTGSLNIGVGNGALSANTTGSLNIAIGASALLSNTSGFANTAIGVGAMESNSYGVGNVAVGTSALYSNTSGSGNTAIGVGAMGFNIDGLSNVAIGLYALLGNISGYQNIAIGYKAGGNLINSSNICIGNDGSSTDTGVIRIGTENVQTSAYVAGIYGVTPPEPTALVIINDNGQLGTISASFLNTLTTATNCDTPSTLVQRDETGSFAATTITLTGNSLINYAQDYTCGDIGQGFIWAPNNQNTLIGSGVNNSNSTNGSANTAVGYSALANNSTGGLNTAIGVFTLYGNTTGGRNSALGYGALFSSTIATDCTAIGYEALGANTASQLTAVGSGALKNNTLGTLNTAVGYNALNTCTIGQANTALGYSAGSLTYGSNNIYIGANVTGNASDSGVIAIGINNANPGGTYINGIYGVTPPGPNELVTINNNGQLGSSTSFLNTLTTATSCATPSTIVQRDSTGSFAATTITLTGDSLINYAQDYTCGAIGQGYIWAPTSQNTIIGLNAGNSNTLTGTDNVVLGYTALANIGSGFANTVLGTQAGSNIITGTNNIYLGTLVTGTYDESGTIRIGTENVQQNCYIAGIWNGILASASTVLIDQTGLLGTIVSSARYKKNIADLGDSTSDIYRLRPVSFNYLNHTHTEYGLIAEEVDMVYPNIVIKNSSGQPETVQYQYLPVMMLNEMQKDHAALCEVKQVVHDLVLHNKKLEAQIQRLEKQIRTLSQQ